MILIQNILTKKILASKILIKKFLITDHSKLKILNKATLGTLVNELFNWYGYFLRLSGDPDLFAKVFLINSKFV